MYFKISFSLLVKSCRKLNLSIGIIFFLKALLLLLLSIFFSGATLRFSPIKILFLNTLFNPFKRDENSLDFNKVPQNVIKSTGRKIFWFPEEYNSRRFFKKFGWYSSEYFYDWLEEVIAGQCDGNRRATFSDFKDRDFRDLYIMATNVSRQRVEVFSADHTPEVAVADAVRMSMSIPIFFEALRFDGQKFGDGDYYVDGGLYDNFPTHIFDEPVYAGRYSAVGRRTGFQC